MMDCEFPLQVDGSSDDAFLIPRGDFQRHVSLATSSSEGTHTGDESMYDLEFEGTVSTAARLQQRVEELGGLVDEEMTEGSSDEEEEEEGTRVLRQDEIRRNREVARTSLGSRWVWLEHRVAELNKHLCRLDHLIQKRPGRENFVFAPPLSPACFCSIPNRALANGGLVAVASLNHRGKVVNGFNHHTSGTPSFTPLLLADSILGSRLQVGVRGRGEGVEQSVMAGVESFVGG